jgi:hypothetical protein
MLGWKIVEDLPGTVSGIEGTRKALAGRVVSPVLKFTPDFEVTVSHLVVIPSEQPLFLLGNDIFNAHKAFSFLQLRAAGEVPQIELWDAHRSKMIIIKCVQGPSGGRSPSQNLVVTGT